LYALWQSFGEENFELGKRCFYGSWRSNRRLFRKILVEWWRENRKLRDRHFEDIKRRCLEPILKRLYDLKGNFVFGESGPEWTGSYEIEKLLASDVHWWESFSFKDGFGADALLYEDLKNHYPDLYRDLQNIEKRVRAGYTEYLQAVYELLKIRNIVSIRRTSITYILIFPECNCSQTLESSCKWLIATFKAFFLSKGFDKLWASFPILRLILAYPPYARMEGLS